jgi:hypothetical protein
MKVNNYLVTYTDLTTMLNPQGSPATGNRIGTKLFITTNYYVDETASPFSTYSSTRCPRYQDIVPKPLNSTSGAVCLGPTYVTQDIGIFDFLYGDGTYYASTTTYADSGSASAGAVTLVGGASSSRTFYSQPNGVRYIKITSGSVSTIKEVGTSCTPVPLPYSYTLYYDYNDGLPVVVGFTIPDDACSAVNSFTVYSNYSPISVGATLYYDIYGTTEIEAVPSSAPSQNYYAIGNNIIQFSDNYTINSITSCPVYAGDVWFGTYSGEACSESSPQQYLYWEGSLLFYNGLVFYTDMALTIPYDNTSGYTYCRSDGSGGGFDEFNLSGNTLGSATGVAC